MLTKLSFKDRIKAGEEFQRQGIEIALASAEAQRRSATIAIQGASITAGAYRRAAQSTLQISNYNNSLDALKTDRQVEATRRDSRNLVSSQVAAAASTGFATTSKSFLSVIHETLSSTESQIIDLRNSASQRQRGVEFETQVQITALENQARAAEFAGAVQAWRSTVDAELATAQAERSRISG